MASTKPKALTSGPIARQLLVLAAPLLLGSVLQQLYNAADTLIVQRLAGEAAFSSVGVAGTVMNLFLFIISGACTGISIVMASLYGAQNEKKLRCESWMATVFGLAFTLLIALLALFLIRPLLRLIATPEALMEGAARYLLIIFLGMPAAFLYNLGAAALRAIGNTDKATLFLTLSVLLNILLDLFFVGPLALGVAGAALATVLSQLFSALCCLVYILRRKSFLIFRREDMHVDGPLLRQTANFALISALNKSSLYIGKLLVQGVVNTIGLDAIAGFTAGSRIENIANTFAVSGGEALSVFVAQNLGAGQRRRAREGFRTWLRISILSSLLISTLMYVTSKGTVGLFLSGSSGMVCGTDYLRYVSLFYLTCFVNTVFTGWNRGAGENDVYMAGTIGQVSLRALLSWLMAPRFGLNGVAFATGIGWILLIFFKAIMYSIKKRKDPPEADGNI